MWAWSFLTVLPCLTEIHKGEMIMKKTVAFISALVLCLSATACCCVTLPDQSETTPVQTQAPQQLPEEQPEETQGQIEETAPPETQPPTEPVTEPIQQMPVNDVPYTTQLSAARNIYNGPGNDYSHVQDVGLTGIYTIVAEKYDAYGNLWGKLRSGIGWVQLSGRLPESNYVRTCPQCGISEPDVFFENASETEICVECNYWNTHAGLIYCWQCGADCTFRGVEEDGRCEDCYYG